MGKAQSLPISELALINPLLSRRGGGRTGGVLAPPLDVSAHVVEASARRASLGAASWTKTAD